MSPVLAEVESNQADRIQLLLNKRTLVVDENQRRYVQHAVDDLKSYLNEITSIEPTVQNSFPSDKASVVLIGSDLAGKVLSGFPSKGLLGEESFVLKSVVKDGQDCLVVSGAAPKGTKFAIYELMKRIRTDGRKAYLEGPVNVRSMPAFKLRGMHLNGWPFDYPYAFRRWSEQDWKRYADILSYQGVNLFYIWPFMEIIPVPLSKEDEEYLQEFRRVVDYAQREHGMKVWMMQSANRIATGNLGVRDPRARPYWRPAVQVDMNPADPEQFQKIMDSRRELFRIVNNVDGVCTIDSDPGGWKNSPVSDWAKLLNGCRTMLTEYNIHKDQTKLINWLHLGWGYTGQVDFNHPQNDIIRGLEKEVSGSTMFIAGWLPILRMCKEEGVLAKTVTMPYGTIEGEPSYPTTGIAFDGMKSTLDRYEPYMKRVAGAMGNVQCPLIQFPHVYYYLNTIWDYDYRKQSERDVLLDVSEQLYPEHAQLLADCYAAMKEPNADKVAAFSAQLDKLINSKKLGRPGVLGRKLFPDQAIVARSLMLQLRFKAARDRFFQDVNTATTEIEYRKLFETVFDAYLDWDEALGWHDLWGKNWGISGTPFFWDARLPAVAVHLKRTFGSTEKVNTFFDDLGTTLYKKHKKKNVEDYCIWFMKEIARTAEATAITGLAQKATATASRTPNPQVYPARQANDGSLNTLYWPGALTENNTEWIQLTWPSPQTFHTVKVYFLKHPSMVGRTIHLQRENAAGVWHDFTTTVIKEDPAAKFCLANFEMQSPVTVSKVRVVNLLDLFEIEIH